MLEDLETVRLVGYELPADIETGISTALYAAHAQSNQVLLAIPEIEGDKSSSISSFEAVTPEQTVSYLAAEDCREVSVGDPWRDAFVMNGKFYFGTPSELSNLVDEFENFRMEYPLTVLDLETDQPGESRREAVAAAYNFVSEKVGREYARSWVIEAYLRSRLLVILRRRLNAQNASSLAFEAVRHLHVFRNERLDTISINLLHLPDGLTPQDLNEVDALKKDEAVSLLMSDLPEDLSGFSLKVNIGKSSAPEPYVPKPVLIVPFGVEAGRLARNVSRAKRFPRFVVDHSWPTRMFEVWEDYEVDRLSSVKLSDYSIVVALVDEGSPELAVAPGLTAIQEMLRQKDAPQLLVAPNLPDDRPSRHFEPDAQMSFFESFHGQLLLDTSFVRSPAWSGDQVKSLSRRIMDHIEKACLVLLSKKDVLERFSEHMNRRAPSILCVYPKEKTRHIIKGYRGYHSEAVGFSSATDRHIANAHLEDMSQSSVRRSLESGMYAATLRPFGEGNFDELAEHAWVAFSNRDSTPFDIQNVDTKLKSSSGGLSYPQYSAEVLLFDEPQNRDFLLIAESPTLELICHAEKAGQQIVRYTDKGSIRKFGDVRRRRQWNFELPEDFRPPRRLPEADLPCVFRRAHDGGSQFVLAKAWRRWVDQHPNHPLVAVGKVVLPTGVAARNKVGTMVAISERELDRVGKFRDPALEELLGLLVPQSSFGATSVLLEPFEYDDFLMETSRWAFREGRYPIVPRKIPAWLTVPRGWIVFDGDIYSAAVVASGILETWLKGHSPRGSGWGRRAVRQSDLDGFPWPDAFELIGYPATVSFPDPPQSFSVAVHDLSFPELTEEFQDPSQKELVKEIDFDTKQALLAETLDLYGLFGIGGEGEALTLLRDRAARNSGYRIRPKNL